LLFFGSAVRLNNNNKDNQLPTTTAETFVCWYTTVARVIDMIDDWWAQGIDGKVDRIDGNNGRSFDLDDQGIEEFEENPIPIDLPYFDFEHIP
jgi:hypothetical protein